MLRRTTLEVDEDDWRDIELAMLERLRMSDCAERALPPGEGNLEGRALGEICRSFLECLGTIRQKVESRPAAKPRDPDEPAVISMNADEETDGSVIE